jgi:hypothetical protein
MLKRICPACGMKVPLQGEVCPYCKAEKPAVAAIAPEVVVFGVFGMLIGMYFGGVVGGLFLAIVGVVVGYIVVAVWPSSRGAEKKK